jgi:hypothetical protein
MSQWFEDVVKAPEGEQMRTRKKFSARWCSVWLTLCLAVAALAVVYGAPTISYLVLARLITVVVSAGPDTPDG